ncbi:hypothetical protein [Nesterenkonia haasae]|uniref:hypothetical protein n=1 Tax=Nesterenkonia haasae TaxID=2587813 RepID=UPI0013909044|nr:hypothetical protein [Nesterenkonia haasae]NDK31236.1 hypothetical protein [Nesterenkonia haasae]
MTTVNGSSTRSTLLQVLSMDDDNAAHRLRHRVNRAELVRVRRGCYFSASDWLRSPPWDRHLIATVATGLARGQEIFCRETALALYGVPLLEVPQTVHVRTHNNGQCGRRGRAAITGAAPRSSLARTWHQTFGEEPSGEAWLRRFKGVDTKRVQYPLRFRESLRRGLDPRIEGDYSEILQNLTPSFGERFDPGGIRLQVEPLPLCVVDTVCRSDMSAGVIILDAVLAGRHRGQSLDRSAFNPWLRSIPSLRAQTRWLRAIKFADPLSESPGESLSRLRISQLGFRVPTLQHSITTPDGTRYRADFCWEEARLVGEFDGHMKYTRARDLTGTHAVDVVIHEKTRERRIEQQGYRVVRWDWNDLRSPERLRGILTDSGVPRVA